MCVVEKEREKLKVELAFNENSLGGFIKQHHT